MAAVRQVVRWYRWIWVLPQPLRVSLLVVLSLGEWEKMRDRQNTFCG